MPDADNELDTAARAAWAGQRELTARDLPQPEMPRPEPGMPDGLRQRLVEAIGTARESVDAASRSLAELDLPDHDARSREFSENLMFSRYRNDDGSPRERSDGRADYERKPLSESSPEVRQRLTEIGSDWKDQLERAEGRIGPVVGQLDAAVTALDAAARTAHDIPRGRIDQAMAAWEGRPERSMERDLGGMAAYVGELRDRTSEVAESAQSARASLDEFVLNEGADGSESEINTARGEVLMPRRDVDGVDPGPDPAIRRISVLDAGIRGRLDGVSAQLGRLSSSLGESGSAATAEQDLRLRTSGSAARGHGGTEAGK